MKKFFFIFLLFVPLTVFSQESKEQYYIYNIVSFEGQFTKEDFKVYYDNGLEVKRYRNEKGDKLNGKESL